MVGWRSPKRNAVAASTKGYVPPRPRAVHLDGPLKTTWDEVFAAALEVRLPDPTLVEHPVTRRPVAMEEKVDLILDTLRKVERVRFSSLVRPWAERMHGVMTFLAGLELGRRKEVTLRQSKPFSELWLFRADDNAPPAARHSQRSNHRETAFVKPTQIVEALLFASDAPLNASEIARADATLNEDAVERAVHELRTEYEENDRAFEVVEIAEGYQLLTRAEFAPYLERFDTVPRPNRLSAPGLEALAIIAYRQPIGRIEVEYIRGVSSAGVIRTLVERGLVDVVGRDEGIGRPLLYGTTQKFLEHFGFSTLDELPRPEELPVVLRDRIPIGPRDDSEGDQAEASAQGD